MPKLTYDELEKEYSEVINVVYVAGEPIELDGVIIPMERYEPKMGGWRVCLK